MPLKNVCRFLLILIFFVFYSNADAQATWMTDNAALLAKKKLNEIALPGAHDAGTFAIETSGYGDIKIREGSDYSSPDSRKLKRLLAFDKGFSNWAKAQERTTAEMLGDGIRYFDIRVCVNAKRILMTCHGIYGAPLESILDDVKTFTAAHPGELVLLGFNHFWDRQFQISRQAEEGSVEGLTADKWTELIALVKNKLGGKLVSGKKFSPNSRFAELRQLKKDNQVIALFDTDDAPDDEFVWKRREENTWVGGWDANTFKRGTLEILENAKNNEYAGKFYAVRSSVTPDEGGKLIRKGFFSKSYPHSLGEFANLTNPVVLGWIKNEWAGKYPVNLVWSDFYNRTDLVKLAKYLNGIKVDLTDTNIGEDTNWTQWKKDKNDEPNPLLTDKMIKN